MFNRIRHTLTALAAAAALTVAAGNVHAATDITGAGSSFVYPVLSKWSAAFVYVIRRLSSSGRGD